MVSHHFFCFSALNVIFYFQTSVQTSLTLSAFEFAIFDFEHSSFAILNVIICLCNEAALALFFCHKAVSTFYLYWGHIYTSFIPKLCQHPSFPWSHENIPFASKPCHRSTLHSHRSHEATSTIHFCYEAMTTFHISTEVMPILVFATKPRQHFICTEAMKLRQQLIFSIKPWQHSTLVLKSCQYSFLPRNHINTSFAPKLCQRSSLSWSHDNTPH